MLFLSEGELSPKPCITLICHSHLNNPQRFHWHCLPSAPELPGSYLSPLHVDGLTSQRFGAGRGVESWLL